MLLLNLPNELLEITLSSLDWQDILSFICTTKHITDGVVSKSGLTRLRHACRSRLLAYETDQRGQRQWPFEQSAIKKPWWDHGQGPHLWKPVRHLECLPCYTCLQTRPIRMFTTGMSSGPRALGQKDASERKCIHCGVRTGLYVGGCKMAAACAVCIGCGSLMCPRKGWLRNPQDLKTITPKLGRRNINLELLFGESRKMASMRFWWWTYSHKCFECVVAENWSAKDFFAKKIRAQEKEARLQKIHQHYTRTMLASLRKRWEKGRLKREHLGIPEPAETPAIDALRAKRIPFPKYRPQKRKLDEASDFGM